jgi:hypothetical protein
MPEHLCVDPDGDLETLAVAAERNQGARPQACVEERAPLR